MHAHSDCCCWCGRFNSAPCVSTWKTSMAAQSVYSLLLQGFHADKSAARLLLTLNELAGRLEVCPWLALTCPQVRHTFGSSVCKQEEQTKQTIQQHAVINRPAVVLQAAESSVEAARRLQRSNLKCSDPSNLQLPDPAQGTAPQWCHTAVGQYALIQPQMQYAFSSLLGMQSR